jgi:hypothetical protein
MKPRDSTTSRSKEDMTRDKREALKEDIDKWKSPRALRKERLEESLRLAAEAEARAKVKVFRVLTDEESRMVVKGMRQSGSESEVMASLEGDSITRRNLLTLQPGAWLSDEVIHYYFSLLRERDRIQCEQTGGRRR